MALDPRNLDLCVIQVRIAAYTGGRDDANTATTSNVVGQISRATALRSRWLFLRRFLLRPHLVTWPYNVTNASGLDRAGFKDVSSGQGSW